MAAKNSFVRFAVVASIALAVLAALFVWQLVRFAGLRAELTRQNAELVSLTSKVTVGSQGPAGLAGSDGLAGPPGAPGVGARGAAGPAGPAGDDGADGAAGADGADGTDGADGADGATGPQGPQGPAGTPAPPGAVTSVSAGFGLSNSGTATDPILEINDDINNGLSIVADVLTMNDGATNGLTLTGDTLTVSTGNGIGLSGDDIVAVAADSSILVGAGGISVGTVAATSISIVDLGTYFTSTDVEGALQEVGTSLGTLTGFTPGSVIFADGAGALGQDNAGLFFDDAGDALRVPTIVGGTAATSDLTFQTTTGVGASGADMHFLVGNDGATEAMTILNAGNVGIGMAPGSDTLTVANSAKIGAFQFSSNVMVNPDGNMHINYSGGRSSFLYAGGTSALAALYTPDGGTTQRFGIGISSPSSKLHVSDTLAAATGDETAQLLEYTTNKLTSGDDYGLRVVQTDTASPGTSYLTWMGVGAAPMFTVTNAGNITAALSAQIGTGTDALALSSVTAGGLDFSSTGSVGWFSGAAPGAGTRDSGLSRAAAGVVEVNNGTAGTLRWLAQAGRSSRAATQTVTDSVALTADNSLSATVLAGRSYKFRVQYIFDTTNTSGVQVDLGGGSATFTDFDGSAHIYSLSLGSFGTVGELTSSTTAVGMTATGTLAEVTLEGTFTCNAAGTIIPRFAQNAETVAAESVVAHVNSSMVLEDIP